MSWEARKCVQSEVRRDLRHQVSSLVLSVFGQPQACLFYYTALSRWQAMVRGMPIAARLERLSLPVEPFVRRMGRSVVGNEGHLKSFQPERKKKQNRCCLTM
jgi:hypothetical protein